MNLHPPVDSDLLGYLSAQAASTKYHRFGGLKDRPLSFLCSRGWKSEIKVSAGLISSEASLAPVKAFLCVSAS